jgi:hypothetical protein
MIHGAEGMKKTLHSNQLFIKKLQSFSITAKKDSSCAHIQWL